MTRRITYRAGEPTGTVITTPREGQAEVVPPLEFYRSLFNLRINGTAILTMLPEPPDLSAADLKEVERGLAETYWEHLGGVVIPLRVQRLIAELVRQDTEGLWLRRVSAGMEAIMSASTMTLAEATHAEERTSWVLAGAREEVTHLHGMGGEFFSDYFLLQRAIVEDMRNAEQNLEGGSRIPYLRRLEDAGGFVFEQVFQNLMSPERLADHLPPGARRDVENYMARRKPFDESGLFEALGFVGPLF